MMSGSIAAASLFSWRSNTLSGASKINKKDLPSLPAEIVWLDESTYEVLAAIIDAFLPSIRPEEITDAQLDFAMDTVHQNLKRDTDVIFADKGYLRSEDIISYLCVGALERGVLGIAVEAVQKLLTKTEQQLVYSLLKLLSTIAGSALVIGKPAAFQDLPLKHRVQALATMRDSSIPSLRSFYQTMKRVTGNLFFSYTEHGGRNPTWDKIGYDPFSTVSKPGNYKIGGSLSSVAIEEDKLLRNQVNFQTVCESLLGPTGASSVNSIDTGVLELDVDAVVVGSGAGGGMMASQLAKAGLRVLVLEKGGFYRATEFSEWRECQAMLHSFEKGGLCQSAEGSVLVLAGSSVGGGTTINWSASFRVPEHVREDWERNHGLDIFRSDGKFEESMNAVHGLVNVNTDNSFYKKSCRGNPKTSENGLFAVNGNNQLLWEGAEKVGYKPEKIPRNVKNCVDCGHCCAGCPYGSKQSTMTALMEPLLLKMAKAKQNPDKAQSGSNYDLHILPHCHASKVLYESDNDGKRKAIGVEAEVKVFDQSDANLSVKQRLEKKPIGARKLRINAKVVVSAAGALHTPALLLRSGLRGDPQCPVGSHLALHPVLGVAGLFPKDTATELASGVSMGVVIRDPPIYDTSSTAPDRKSWQIAPETPPLHAGLMGLMFPWTGGLGKNSVAVTGMSTKLGMLGWRNSACFIAISRDRSQKSNGITIDAEGNTVINYSVTEEDNSLILAGLEANLRMMRAAGSRYLYVAHENFPWHYCRNESPDDNEEERFEKYIESIRNEGVRPVSLQVFSAHQLSSCRMGRSPQYGPVSPSGELFECKNLFVADGSVVPSALGINPMITIEAFAHMISRNVIAHLEATNEECRQKISHFRTSNQW